MILRIFSALVLIPVVVASIYVAPLWTFLLIVSGCAALAVWEFTKLSKAAELRLSPAVAFFIISAPWVIGYLEPKFMTAFALASLVSVITWSVLRHPALDRSLLSSANNLLALTYLGIPFSLMTLFHPATRYPLVPDPADRFMLLLVTIWATDSGAYFAGRAFGRHKVTPVISPNKSLEGFAGGLVIGVLASWAFGSWLGLAGPVRLLLDGLVVALASMIGDLFESLLKRGVKLKDTSSLIPGHGGILDRIDSLLVALPAFLTVEVLWP